MYQLRNIYSIWRCCWTVPTYTMYMENSLWENWSYLFGRRFRS